MYPPNNIFNENSNNYYIIHVVCIINNWKKSLKDNYREWPKENFLERFYEFPVGVEEEDHPAKLRAIVKSGNERSSLTRSN